MNTLITAGSKSRLRKGAAFLGLSLSLPLIALGTAAPSGAAAGADIPFAGGLFASGASYEDTSSTTFASVDETTLAPTTFGDANTTLPDGEKSFDGLAYNPINDFLYTTTDDGKSADLSIVCNVPLIEFACNFDEDPEPVLTSLAVPAGAPSAATSISILDAATSALVTKALAGVTADAVAVPEPTYFTLNNGVPGEPDLYRLDSEGDLDFVGRIPAPATPAVPTVPGIGLSHSAALGFAASSAADGTYLVPGIQLRANLDLEALLDRINGDDELPVTPGALEPIGSPLIDDFLPELTIEAGLSVGHVDPATAATTYVDVDLSAPSCLGVNTYAAEGQLSNIITTLLPLLGLDIPATPELLGGGLLDWAVNPSNGLLYSYVTPGLLGLLYPDAPDAIVLTINPDTGAAVCTPVGTAPVTLDDLFDEDLDSIDDVIEALAPIFFPVGGDAFLSNGDLLLWATTLQDQLLVVPADVLAACVGGGSCADLATGSAPSIDSLVIGDLASNPFPDLSVTPTLSKGTTALPFGFTISEGGYDAVQLVQNQTGTYQAVPTNTPLTITDTVPAGFDLVLVTCTNGPETITPVITNDSVTIELVSADDVSCVFLHDPETPTTVVVVTPPQLAATGANDTVPLTVLGLGLMFGGAALTVMSRRRVRA